VCSLSASSIPVSLGLPDPEDEVFAVFQITNNYLPVNTA